MTKVNINRQRFSNIVWDNIFDSTELQLIRNRDILMTHALDNEEFRKFAEYNTGSISFGAMQVLYAVSAFFKPKCIAEVGTFIGNSTSALALGSSEAEIHTCDISNNIDLFPNNHNITQYKKVSSTSMFNQLVTQEKNIDLLFLDGRLSSEDIVPLKQLFNNHTVVAFDDFESFEKGTLNARLLMTEFGTHYYLIYPPKNMKCTIALMIPKSLVAWTNQ
jgi:predicted O-methyltransferase YrrM